MAKIRARDFEDSQGVIVTSGTLLAREVLRLLQTEDRVEINLRGMSAISSSYFNIFLQLLMESMGSNGIQRISFDFVSPIQRRVFERSLDAVVRDAVKP